MPIFPDRSPRFEAFIAPARLRPQLWRLIAGLVLAGAVWFGAGFALVVLFSGMAEGSGDPRALLGFLASFLGMIAGLAAAAWLLQGRSLSSMIGPGGLRLRAFLVGALTLTVLVTLASLPGLFSEGLQQRTPVAEWARWLPLAVPAILIQITGEELLFRGYVMQGLAARFRSRLIWWVLPAVMFGSLHWNGPEFGANAWLVVLAAVLMGLVLGDIAARTGNLSGVLGVHFANNALALLVIATPSALGSLSLFVSEVDPGDAEAMRGALLANIGLILAGYAGWILWWHRYGERR